jgi:hypothetical protein
MESPRKRVSQPVPRAHHAPAQGRWAVRDGVAGCEPVRRGREDANQGTASGRLQPAHHCPTAQRRVQPIHRDQDEPPVLHQGRRRKMSGISNTRIHPATSPTARPSPSGLRNSSWRRSGGRSGKKAKTLGRSAPSRSRPAATTSTSRIRTCPKTRSATRRNCWPTIRSSLRRSRKPGMRCETNWRRF